MVVSVAVVAVTLAVGLVLGLGMALDSSPGAVASPDPSRALEQAQEMPSGAQRRDAIAAAPMVRAPRSAASPGQPSLTAAQPVVVPKATQVGPAGVPTGFDQSPVGAMAQLAAIETTVLEQMSVQSLGEVYDRWAQPGAVPMEQWELAVAVQAFLGSGAGPYAESMTQVHVTPVGGLVKGTDGDSWAVVCVLVQVDATLSRHVSTAWGHCERMEWDGTRWLVAPGAAPALAPSTWPGTDWALRAGWAAWEEEV